MSVSDLKHCGHTGDLRGVCQFRGCGKKLCPDCLEDCARCGRSLCKEHQEWVDGRETPICEDCLGPHVSDKAKMTALSWAVNRFRGGN